MRVSPGVVRLVILTALALPLNLSCRASAPHRSHPSPSSQVTVLPFTIEPQALPGAPAGPKENLRLLLAGEASSSAGEALRKHPAEAAGVTAITGTVQIPVSLPPEVRGLHAHRQKGRLAAATVRLLGPDGKTIREAEASLSWGEVRWLTGAPRFRRNRPPEEVLRDAVGEVVERAVERLGKKDSGAHDPDRSV